MFLIDKYAPTCVENMFFHEEILRQLEIMSKKDNIPHLLFYGPQDSGKKTMVQRFLELVFGDSVNELQKVDYLVVSTGTSNKTSVQLKQSNHHIIIEPNGTNFDKHIIHEVVKVYARTIPLSIFATKRTFKVVLINNAQKLSLHAQTALRRTMELYSKNCIVILVCDKLSSIIDPIRSRCSLIRIPSPSDHELLLRLIYIANSEGLKPKFSEYDEMLRIAKGRIKAAIWLLEYYKLNKTVWKKKNVSHENSYDGIIKKIITNIMVPNITRIQTIRNLLYDIIVTNVNPTKIISSMLEGFINNKKIDDIKLKKIIDVAETYDHRLMLARRSIIHLEAFIVHVFQIIHEGALNSEPKKVVKKPSAKKRAATT